MALRHQIVRRLPGGMQDRLRAWNAGRRFRAFRADQWEYSACLAPLVGVGDHVVDAGANIGYLTRVFADWVGRSGKVLAFEPVPQTFSWLFHNIAASGLEQVTPLPHGLSDHLGTATMEVPDYATGGSNFYESRVVEAGRAVEGRTVTVSLAPLDRYSEQLPRLSLVKIDVEGHEAAVVAGASDILARHRPALLIEVQGEPGVRTETAEMWERLRALGYRAWVMCGVGLVPWTPGCGAVDVMFLQDAHQGRVGVPVHER